MKSARLERGMAWELLNCRWLFASVFSLGVLSFMSFFYIGFKTNNRGWKIWGIIYTIALFGLGFNPALDFIFKGLILSSVIHAFWIRKKYLIELDAIQSK